MSTIAVAADHAGYTYKEDIRKMLESSGYTVVDFGTDSEKPVDYPDLMRAAAISVANGESEAGVLFGGSGNGEAIVANKVRGIRCAVCWNEHSARLAKEHNNANMISIGQRLVTVESAREIVRTWLAAEFQRGRHQRRVEQIHLVNDW